MDMGSSNVFFFYSLYGLIIACFAFQLDEEEAIIDKQGLVKSLTTSLTEIKSCFFLPEIQRVLIFIFCAAILKPNFKEFNYFFKMDIA